MNCVERVKQICKERKIPISKLEKDLGFSNGYVGQLKKGSFPAERLSKIADYLSLSPQYLMYGEEPAPDPVLTSRDERDIEKILARTPMQRFGDANELVGATLLLASSNAGKFITGIEMIVDGGFACMSI